MLGKKEQAEALGSDPFTHFSEFEFLGQSLWPESGAVWRKLTAGCKKQHLPPWMRDGAQTRKADIKPLQPGVQNVLSERGLGLL